MVYQETHNHSSPEVTNLLACELPSSSEGSNARKAPSGGKPSVVKGKAGRKRRGRSMGRYPFLTWVKRYLSVRGQTYAEATTKELQRRYRRMEKDLKMLVEHGKVSSANPEKMSSEDVLTYINLLKSRGLKEKGISHNLTALKNLLDYVGNPAVQRFKAKYPFAVPKSRSPRLPIMEDKDYHAILQEARSIDSMDWKRLKAYALVVLAISTGMRCKELRLCQITDVYLDEMKIRAEHVKGEGSYGQAREIAIRPEARVILAKYLRARNKMVAKMSPGNLALFPALRGDGDGYLSTNSLEKLKRLVETESGIKFDLRMCRRTYGQKAIDEGVSTEAVSRLLGHSTTKTTENYYCRMRQDTAIREAQSVWQGPKSYPDVKTPKIESRFEVTGYV